MIRPRHRDKDVEEAVQRLERAGWRIEMTQGHAWARAKCPQQDRSGCIVSIWSTPRNGRNHARQLLRKLERCPHDQ